MRGLLGVVMGVVWLSWAVGWLCTERGLLREADRGLGSYCLHTASSHLRQVGRGYSSWVGVNLEYHNFSL